MFEKMLKKRKQENLVMEEVINLLRTPNNWVRKDLEYRHIEEPELIIRWGYEYFRSGSRVNYCDIISPEKIKIPFRYRSEVGRLLQAISGREDFSDSKLDFLYEYLQGEYTARLMVDCDKVSEMTIWLDENNITDFCIVGGSVIWFKSIEDAMAFKLRWL